jgi:hypothetical protein
MWIVGKYLQDASEMPFSQSWMKESIFMNDDDAADLAKAQDFAIRYRCELINLNIFHLQKDIFQKIPIDMMCRYNFVPLEVMPDGRIAIAVADPSQLMSFDEISLLLGKRLSIHVATLTQINEFLNKFDRTKGIDEDPEQIVASSPDEPNVPGGPEAPVFAPLRPKPRLRSGAAAAIPEKDQE